MDVADIKLDTRITDHSDASSPRTVPLQGLQLVRNLPGETDHSKWLEGSRDAVKDARATVSDIIDPFAALTI